MSKLLENKQMVHIISETVVFFGLTFYFSQKNKKLTEKIEALSQRLEEQEDLIQKHDNIIRKFVASMNNQQQLNPVSQKSNEDQKKKKNVKIVTPPVQPFAKPVLIQSESLKKTKSPPPLEKVHTTTPSIVRIDEDEDSDEGSFSDTDLDNELVDELEDLKKND